MQTSDAGLNSSCSIFRDLTNLIELDLSHNALTSVPRFGLEDCKHLMRLSLRGNLIREIGEEDFYFLKDLNSLDLAHCGIETVDEDAFRNLQNLEYLRLDGNQLKTMTPLRSFSPKLR